MQNKTTSIATTPAMTTKSTGFLLRKKTRIMLGSGLLISIGLLYGCSSFDTKNNAENSAKSEQPAAYKIKIINASNSTINEIRYKPCNSNATQYQHLTNNLRPMEKFTINIYSQCIDLVARNAFKKKLVDMKNVDLQSMKIWTIR